MKLSDGHLAAWELTAAVLCEINSDEVELLPDIAESAHAPSVRIEGVPGAFDFDIATINSIAMTVFGAALVALKSAAPKLFDAAIDVSKETLKKVITTKIDERQRKPALPADSRRVHEVVRQAVLERRLSEANAQAIANAVVAKLAISGVDTN